MLALGDTIYAKNVHNLLARMNMGLENFHFAIVNGASNSKEFDNTICLPYVGVHRELEDAGKLLLENKDYKRAMEVIANSIEGAKAWEGEPVPKEKVESFQDAIKTVKEVFRKDWEESDECTKELKLQREKNALMGIPKDVEYFNKRIEGILKEEGLLGTTFPTCYTSLWEGVFAELYGVGPITGWVYDKKSEYKKSSSAKIIGEKIYYLIDGKSQLQPWKITREMFSQIKKTALLWSIKEREEKGFHELYLYNGIRLTIYSGDRTKEGQEIMVFRKYVLEDLTLSHLVDLGTLPRKSLPIFQTMSRLGYNIVFTGAVRSGKTTMLQIWQKMENPILEGLAISTDPETPWHKICEDAPIMQLVADEERLSQIYKSLLRGDNDYVILEEMRDAYAFKLAVDIATSGTKRCKATIHSGNPVEIPYKMAWNIAHNFGGDIHDLIWQIYSSFDFIIEMESDDEDRGCKRLKSIGLLTYDQGNNQVAFEYICKYDHEERRWNWSFPKSLAQKKNKGKEDEILLRCLRDEDIYESREGWNIRPAYYKR